MDSVAHLPRGAKGCSQAQATASHTSHKSSIFIKGIPKHKLQKQCSQHCWACSRPLGSTGGPGRGWVKEWEYLHWSAPKTLRAHSQPVQYQEPTFSPSRLPCLCRALPQEQGYPLTQGFAAGPVTLRKAHKLRSFNYIEFFLLKCLWEAKEIPSPSAASACPCPGLPTPAFFQHRADQDSVLPAGTHCRQQQLSLQPGPCAPAHEEFLFWAIGLKILAVPKEASRLFLSSGDSEVKKHLAVAQITSANPA